jgi:hypothetical protein
VEWDKFALSVVRNPILRRFRSAARCHIIDFVELSVRYEPKGIVEFLDDEIANDLGMGLEQWHNLRDLMIDRKIIRFYMRGPRRIYEVAMWLLPDQSWTDKAGRNHPDARSSEPWSDDAESDLPPIMVSDDYAPRRSAVQPMTAAERQHVSRSRKAAAFAGNRFNAEECLADYRAAREPNPVTNAQPVTLDMSQNPVTQDCHDSCEFAIVTSREQQNESDIDEKDNNKQGAAVTNGRHEITDRDIVDVVVFISEKGIQCKNEVCRISPDVARALVEEVLVRDGNLQVFYDQARRLPYRQHAPDKSLEGMYISSVRGTRLGTPIGRPWGGPSAYEKEVRDRNRREKQQHRDLEAAATRRAAEERDLLRKQEEEQRISAFEVDLTDEERSGLEAEILASLTTFERDRYHKDLREDREFGPNVTRALAAARRRILLERSSPPIPEEAPT